LTWPSLEQIDYDSISLDNDLKLEEDFSQGGLWNAINDLGKVKTLSPDGFDIAFFQHC